MEIVRRALAYRETRAAIVEAGADRLIVQLDEVPAAKIDGRTLEGDDGSPRPGSRSWLATVAVSTLFNTPR